MTPSDMIAALSRYYPDCAVMKDAINAARRPGLRQIEVIEQLLRQYQEKEKNEPSLRNPSAPTSR